MIRKCKVCQILRVQQNSHRGIERWSPEASTWGGVGGINFPIFVGGKRTAFKFYGRRKGQCKQLGSRKVAFYLSSAEIFEKENKKLINKVLRNPFQLLFYHPQKYPGLLNLDWFVHACIPSGQYRWVSR